MICDDCPKRDSCTELCDEVREYVDQDYVHLEEISFPVDKLEYIANRTLFSFADLVNSKDVWSSGLDVTASDLEELYDVIKLTDKQKEVMRLRVGIGRKRLTQQRIAEKLFTFQESIRDRLELCRKKLKNFLKSTA